MSSEVNNDTGTPDSLFGSMNWLPESGIWNGVPVTWEQDSHFQSDLAKKIVELFSSKQLSHSNLIATNHELSNLLIITVPGINNSEAEAQEHVEYLKNLFPGIEVDAIPNKSHGLIIDALEVLFLNYAGFSPNTGNHLRKTLELFHEKNKDNANAKVLLLCHSQGTIHVKNVLEKCPQEIRDRVIVVAIAPAAIFPENCAADIQSYASKRDAVSRLEVFWRSITDFPEDGISEATKAAWENQKQIITLEPHPDAPLFDHSFQSPTFREVIKKAIESYLKNDFKELE